MKAIRKLWDSLLDRTPFHKHRFESIGSWPAHGVVLPCLGCPERLLVTAIPDYSGMFVGGWRIEVYVPKEEEEPFL